MNREKMYNHIKQFINTTGTVGHFFVVTELHRDTFTDYASFVKRVNVLTNIGGRSETSIFLVASGITPDGTLQQCAIACNRTSCEPIHPDYAARYVAELRRDESAMLLTRAMTLLGAFGDEGFKNTAMCEFFQEMNRCTDSQGNVLPDAIQMLRHRHLQDLGLVE